MLTSKLEQNKKVDKTPNTGKLSTNSYGIYSKHVKLYKELCMEPC